MIASSLKEGQEQQDGADEIVDLLLNKGADVNIKSEFPRIPPFFSSFPLVCVCMGGREEEGGVFKDGEGRIGKEKVVLKNSFPWGGRC